ncbi:hypothetical protein HAX54_020542, partial [Datura stramonium]|nr:hypothetical protein [Datura stramonium]
MAHCHMRGSRPLALQAARGSNNTGARPGARHCFPSAMPVVKHPSSHAIADISAAQPGATRKKYKSSNRRDAHERWCIQARDA